MRNNHRPSTASHSPTATMSGTDRLNSQALFQGQREICIEHADQVYRLRITRQGKLILTK